MKLSGLRSKDLWWFSVPSIVASVFEPLASIVDTALVGHLNRESLAALALAVAVFNAITWMFNFLVHTSTQAIADYEAARNPELLRSRVKISLILAMGIGLVCSLVLWLPQDLWFFISGGSDPLRNLFDAYFSPRVGFHVFTVLSITLLSILRGFGRLKLVLGLMVFSTGTNILLSWLFLYPLNWGLSGAAYGTIASHILTTVLGIYFLFQKEELKNNFFTSKIISGQWIRFGKSSFDMFGRSFILTLCFFSSTRLASRLGVGPLGAHQVLLQVWLLASFFLDGLAITGNILGARFYFAGQIKRTAVAFKELLKLGFGVGAVFTFLYALFWHEVLLLFVEDKQILNELHLLKWPIVMSQTISAVAFVFDGLIFGLNGFKFLRRHMIRGALLTYVPLACYSLWSPDLLWIWLGMIFLNLYRGLSGYYYIHRNVFKETH
jgi:multidrug resistance protein, MATE family